jgi:hypothetical protein
MMDDRGQIFTIEGVIAAFILIFALVVIVMSTSVTPLSSSFTNQHIKLELQNVGNDILSTLDMTPIVNTGDPSTLSLLKQSILQWARTDSYGMYSWNNTAMISALDNKTMMTRSHLSDALNFALINKGTAYNVEVRYPDTSLTLHTNKMIWNGDPSENSITVSRYVVLHDSDVYNDNSVIPDISPSTDLHSTIEVRLTLWVM